MEPEEQGRGIIMGVTCLLLLGPFYTIQIKFYVLFCTQLYLSLELNPIFRQENGVGVKATP